MNYKNVEEVSKQRIALVNEITSITLTVSASDSKEDFNAKVRMIDDLQAQLDALPSLEDAGAVPAKLGRPTIVDNGKSRTVKITLSAEDWERLDGLVASGKLSSMGGYFRDLHDSSFSELLIF